MESTTSSPEEVNSTAVWSNKRKHQDGLQEMPLPKHVCWAQGPKLDSPSDFQTQPGKVENQVSHREIESDPESAKDSNSIPCNEDSAMSTDAEYFSMHTSEESSSTSTGCLGYEYGPALDYEGHLIEFGSEVGCSEAENCEYAFSSGKWSVVQDTPESKEPTIDKEFEEYFSMLML